MIDFQLIIYAIGQGILLSFMIGPVFFLLIETSISKGARAAVFFDIGVIIADLLYFSLAYYGSKDLLTSVKNHPSLLFLGGLVLMVYGVSQWIMASKQSTTDLKELPVKNNYLALIFKGIFFNLINIGVLFFWIGVVLIALPNLGINDNQVWPYMLISMGVLAFIDLLKILLAKQFKEKMTAENIMNFKRFVAVALFISGVVLITKTMFSFNILFRI